MYIPSLLVPIYYFFIRVCNVHRYILYYITCLYDFKFVCGHDVITADKTHILLCNEDHICEKMVTWLLKKKKVFQNQMKDHHFE